MSVVTLDFSAATSEEDLWATIKAGLCPKFTKFGCNLDALVDVLRGGFGIDTPIKLRIIGRVAAKAATQRWQQFEETFDEAVEGEYGEEVESLEWVSGQ